MKINRWMCLIVMVMAGLQLSGCDRTLAQPQTVTPVVNLQGDPTCIKAQTDPSVMRLSAAPGSYVSSAASDFTQAASFTSTDKLAATYYFYWYDASNPDPAAGHMNNRIQHEANERPAFFTWMNKEWHKKHLVDMSAAKIDIMLPVYWGAPCEISGEKNNFSDEGLKQLVRAQTELIAQGDHPPKIGMFYDTGSLGVMTTYFNSYMVNAANGTMKIDLTKPVGMERFYLPIRNFYSLVPPELWAMIDGKPVVWLYNTAWVADYNADTFQYIKDRFAQDFGGLEPYIVREKSWQEDKVRASGAWVTDNAYTWGVSLYGYERINTIAAIGPGFDESAIPDRAQNKCAGENTAGVGCPRIRPRDNGGWYIQQWQKVMADAENVNIVAIEVWNEYHEGNSVADTLEFGRQYIELSAQWVQQFKLSGATTSQPGKIGSMPGKIAYVSRKHLSDDLDQNQLLFVSPDGSELQTLLICRNTEIRVEWSPDGQKMLVYLTPYMYGIPVEETPVPTPTPIPPCLGENINGTTYLLDIDSGQFSPLPIQTEYFPPVWSPDSKNLAYYGLTYDSWTGRVMHDFYVMNLETKAATRLGGSTDSFDALAPSWSPDNNQIVYISDTGDLSIVRLDQKTIRLLTRMDGIENASWSPDGEKIVFQHYNQTGYDIFLIHPDGSSLEKIVDNAEEKPYPNWSPDGQHVVFFSRDTNTADRPITLNLIDMQSMAVTVVPKELDMLYSLVSWSPDSKHITFSATENTGGNAKIFIYSLADGSVVNVSQKTDIDGEDFYPKWSP